jgi:hypothetical protein
LSRPLLLQAGSHESRTRNAPDHGSRRPRPDRVTESADEIRALCPPEIAARGRGAGIGGEFLRKLAEVLAGARAVIGRAGLCFGGRFVRPGFDQDVARAAAALGRVAFLVALVIFAQLLLADRDRGSKGLEIEFDVFDRRLFLGLEELLVALVVRFQRGVIRCDPGEEVRAAPRLQAISRVSFRNATWRSSSVQHEGRGVDATIELPRHGVLALFRFELLRLDRRRTQRRVIGVG